MTLDIGSTLGPYRLLEQIGLGGMATVYKAYQTGVDRLVAVKVLPEHYAREPHFVARFKQEARVIAQLEHRNIVPIYGFGEQDGLTYLVMRYLQAGTLKDILIRGELPLADIVRVVADIASALDYAHARGIIHRDVKPSNILIDKHGHAFLTDFGIAKVLEGSGEFTGSAMVGTPSYMAPEQTLSKPVTPQTDVYSLGVMLYEMVTGRPPFEADTPMAVALKHVHEPLPQPRAIKPNLPAEIELVILKALAKEPGGRFRSAGELARALADASHPTPQATTQPSSRLVQLAGMITASKGSEEVTYDVRLELQRQRGLENARKWLKRAPWLGVGLVSAALICAVIGLGTQFLAGQGSIRSTAEALELDYEEATLTVAAYTSTPTLTATYDPVLDVTLTASSLQTQTAAASQTRAAILVIQQQTRSALATQLALTPTPTPTITSQPTATSIPTTFVDVEAGNFTIWNAVKSGRVAFGMSPCWASEAEATSAVQIDPSLTVDGIAAPLIELPSRTITHSPSGSGWCLEWPSKAYFVVTIEVGIHTVSWQWGNRAGSSTFTVVSR